MAGATYLSQATRPEIHPAETVEDADLAFILAYWQRLRGPRAMPRRDEIAPRAIGARSRYVHIYDVLDNGADFRARRVGSAVFTGIAQDQTGRLVSEHPDPGVRLRFSIMLRHVVATAAAARSLSVRLTGDPLRDQTAEVLWLPLGRGETVEQVFAVSSLKLMAATARPRGADTQGGGKER